MKNKTVKEILKNTLIEEGTSIPGIKNISETLVNNGSVHTTVHHRDIWYGGFGNFMKTAPLEGSVGVVTITLSDEVYESELFKSVLQYYAEAFSKEFLGLKDKRDILREKMENLEKLLA